MKGNPAKEGRKRRDEVNSATAWRVWRRFEVERETTREVLTMSIAERSDTEKFERPRTTEVLKRRFSHPLRKVLNGPLCNLRTPHVIPNCLVIEYIVSGTRGRRKRSPHHCVLCRVVADAAHVVRLLLLLAGRRRWSGRGMHYQVRVIHSLR